MHIIINILLPQSYISKINIIKKQQDIYCAIKIINIKIIIIISTTPFVIITIYYLILRNNSLILVFFRVFSSTFFIIRAQ